VTDPGEGRRSALRGWLRRLIWLLLAGPVVKRVVDRNLRDLAYYHQVSLNRDTRPYGPDAAATLKARLGHAVAVHRVGDDEVAEAELFEVIAQLPACCEPAATMPPRSPGQAATRKRSGNSPGWPRTWPA
jgi:hypothetical protein